MRYEKTGRTRDERLTYSRDKGEDVMKKATDLTKSEVFLGLSTYE